MSLLNELSEQEWIDNNAIMSGTKKEFPVLFKYDSKGRPNQWQIIAEGNTYYTIEGIVDGKLTTSKPTIVTGKNIGRSNETSPIEQALHEAQSKFQQKLDKGYNEVLTEEKKFFEPMLAKNINDLKKELFTKRTFIQPKMDGCRCINQNNTLMSRNGKPFVATPHLYQDMVTLDGELYNHEYRDDFNKIISLCKKTKPTDDDYNESAEKVEYWVYDFPDHHGPFSERYDQLKIWMKFRNKNPMIKLVPTYEVYTMEDIEKYHDQFLSEGFEGSIVRLDLGPYEGKRSKQLLKKKDFTDEEFKIIDIVEGVGNRSGMAGNIIVELEDGQHCSSNIKGDFSYLTDLLNNREHYIGKMATVKYFNRTPDNSLRFPHVININRDSYE